MMMKIFIIFIQIRSLKHLNPRTVTTSSRLSTLLERHTFLYSDQSPISKQSPSCFIPFKNITFVCVSHQHHIFVRHIFAVTEHISISMLQITSHFKKILFKKFGTIFLSNEKETYKSNAMNTVNAFILPITIKTYLYLFKTNVKSQINR